MTTNLHSIFIELIFKSYNVIIILKIETYKTINIILEI